jgi:flagellar biosynthesis GTPase FlhF
VLDWGEALDVSLFYGRAAELATLEQWLCHDQCRLVMLLGMGGIGKTALSVRLAEQFQMGLSL